MSNLTIEGTIKKTPNDNEIIAAEKELGFPFPPSYKDFVKTYGSGLLCGLFVIYVPEASNENLNLVKRNRGEKSVISENVVSGYWDQAINSTAVTKEWLLTLEPFGISENGDTLCWDLSKQDEHGEYPIYILEHEQNAAPQVAHSMEEFIDNFCFKQKIDEIFPMERGNKWNLPFTFKPYF